MLTSCIKVHCMQYLTKWLTSILTSMLQLKRRTKKL
nr:MAG TPA: hypothetical protein [Caudoviricetes sp.]